MTQCEALLPPYLLPSHVDQELGAVGAEGDVRGHQDPQPVVVVWKLHWEVPCGEDKSIIIGLTPNCCLCRTPAAPFYKSKAMEHKQLQDFPFSTVYWVLP